MPFLSYQFLKMKNILFVQINEYFNFKMLKKQLSTELATQEIIRRMILERGIGSSNKRVP